MGWIQLVSTVVVTLATLALAILTARYVRLTNPMVEEMKGKTSPRPVLS